MDLKLQSSLPLEESGGPDLYRAWLRDDPDAVRILGARPRSARDLAEPYHAAAARGLGDPCIVTGQQSHWLGGPAFLLYKTATARAAAHELGEALSLPCRPVFWSHSDDADTAEVDHLHIVNAHWDVQRLALGLAPDRRPLYLRELPPNAQAVFEATFEALLPAPGKAPLLEKLLAAGLLEPGIHLSEHFARWFRATHPFDELELVEPRDARDLTRELIRTFVQRSRACAERWQGLDRLCAEKGWSKPFDAMTAACFFLLDEDGRRVPVRLRDDGASFVLDEQPIDASALLSKVENSSETPIAGALLRVLLQSRWLPIVAYVGGPSEIAYQSYACVSHDLFDVPAPRYLPRMQATMISASSLSQLERFGISALEDMSLESLLAGAPENEGEDPFVNESLDDLDRRLGEVFDQLRAHLEPRDSSLGRSLEQTGAQLRSQIEKTRGRIAKVLRNRAGTGARQARKLVHWIRPLGKPQERTLAATQLLARVGPEFPAALRAAARPFTPRHGAWIFPES